jgi:hypothetical protein
VRFNNTHQHEGEKENALPDALMLGNAFSRESWALVLLKRLWPNNPRRTQSPTRCHDGPYDDGRDGMRGDVCG